MQSVTLTLFVSLVSMVTISADLWKKLQYALPKPEQISRRLDTYGIAGPFMFSSMEVYTNPQSFKF